MRRTPQRQSDPRNGTQRREGVVAARKKAADYTPGAKSNQYWQDNQDRRHENESEWARAHSWKDFREQEESEIRNEAREQD